MKIFAFTDLHINRIPMQQLMQRIIKSQPDVIVCCGDFSFFGSGMHKVIRPLNELGLPLLFIPGNHESSQELDSLAQRYTHLINLHNRIITIDTLTFFGYGGGGFSQVDQAFLKQTKTLHKRLSSGDFVFVCHMPIYHTQLDYLPWLKAHRGNKSYREFVLTYQPRIVLCGHFHEAEGKHDTLEKSLLINPGPEGKIIELKKKSKTT